MKTHSVYGAGRCRSWTCRRRRRQLPRPPAAAAIGNAANLISQIEQAQYYGGGGYGYQPRYYEPVLLLRTRARATAITGSCWSEQRLPLLIGTTNSNYGKAGPDQGPVFLFGARRLFSRPRSA